MGFFSRPHARARRHRAAFRQFLQCRGDTAPGRVGACSDRLSTMSAFAEDKESDYGTVKKVRFARARACATRVRVSIHRALGLLSLAAREANRFGYFLQHDAPRLTLMTVTRDLRSSVRL